MLESISEWAYRLLLAVLTLFVFLVVGRFVQMIVTKLFNELSLDYLLEKAGMEIAASKTIGIVVAFVFYFLGVVYALKQLGLEKIAFIAASIVGAVAILLVIALGLTDTAKNFMLGLYLKKKYLGRKELRTGSIRGKIINVGMTKLKVMTKEKDILIVPYSELK